ncbi:MAG TPA: TonB-dependent receptor plug domain-containing protein, partial [Anseongella sp.]|nr:TonB-dependent receptor plug domain-containing protein [Anseongella sp.]
MNRKSTLCRILLMALICSNWPVSGQILAAASSAKKMSSGGEFREASLQHVLSELEKRYKVSFFYKTELIKDFSVRQSDRPGFDNLRKDLNKLLKRHDLTYERTDGNLYVIIGGGEQARTGELPFMPLKEKPLPAAVLQQNSVSGRVTSAADSAALPGVNVVVKGTTIGTSTDTEGQYELQNVPEGATLVFSLLGFAAVERTVDGQQVNVALEPDQQSLEQVVVVGYGTQKRESLTGAISAVTSEDLDRVKGATVSATLAGKIPGVSFRQPDGRPGSSANIQIRNMGNPLYVIDGIQQDAGQFNNLSPNDIESITVLKDASAAIYGVRAANGVVVVTTKRGRTGNRNSINVSSYYGWQNWSRFPETVNAYEWMVGKADAEVNVSGNTAHTPEELALWREG